MRRLLTISVLLFAAVALAAQTAGTISTVAGVGTIGYSGDGGPATAATLNYPFGVALDSAGNLYIADRNNHRIRKVDAATGTITTIAGNGAALYGGDGGAATSASLYFPWGVAVDAQGNVYIADTESQRVRKVDAATGTISTVAGTGSFGFAGDGLPASEAKFRYPTAMVVDAEGNVYITDTNNCRVRKVEASSGIITTVAGNETCGYSGDGGPAVQASLKYPNCMALDRDGNLFIADRQNNRVRKVEKATGVITTVAGNGATGLFGDGSRATETFVNDPTGVAVDAAGNLYIAENRYHRVRKVDASGIITTVAGNGTGGYGGDGLPVSTSTLLNWPFSVAVDAKGRLYIADRNNQRIRRVESTDQDPPTTTITMDPAPNAAGWTAADVAITLTASDGDTGSGVQEISYTLTGAQNLGPVAVNSAMASFSVTAEGETTVSFFARDKAGNTEDPAQEATIRIDKTQPTVAVTGVVNGRHYLLGETVGPACTTTDALSGVAVEAQLSVTGGNADGAGMFTATCAGARDNAGNGAAASASYSVGYGFSGFLPPLGTNYVFKAGRTVPVKWQLTTASGAYVSNLSAVTSVFTVYDGSCEGDYGEPVDTGISGDSGIRYDPLENQYIFNWRTTGMAAGCYRLLLGLNDGTTHAATLRLRP
ncbi:MAG: PxKF domain-containing protein [Terriglobales bacterium]